MRSFARFSLFSLFALPTFLVVASCGAPAPKAPEGSQAPETRALLGSAPDFAFVVRLDSLRADPVYAPMLRDLSKKQDLEEILQGVTAIDAVGNLDGPKPLQVSLVMSVRSAPPFDKVPAEWKKSVDAQKGGVSLPSGVWEYASINSDGWPYGFYVAPNNWVFLTGRAAGHGHDWFSSHVEPPPVVDFGNDALVGLWVGPNALKNPAMAETANEPGSKGLESAQLILRDGTHGDLLYTGLYTTKAFADEAVRITVDRLGMYASVWKSAVDRCPGLSVLGLENESDGRVVRMRVTHIPEAVRAALTCQ